jgi:hypothetical protein
MNCKQGLKRQLRHFKDKQSKINVDTKNKEQERVGNYARTNI